MNDLADLYKSIAPPAPIPQPAQPQQPAPPAPAKGGLPLDVMASVQRIYNQMPAPPPVKQSKKPSGMSLDLEPGWGGRGR